MLSNMVFVMDKLPVGTNNSKRPIPNPKAQGSDPRVHRGELQHMAAELGSYKQAHTSSPPLTLGNSRVVEGPAPLKELGSRAQAMRGVTRSYRSESQSRSTGENNISFPPTRSPVDSFALVKYISAGAFAQFTDDLIVFVDVQFFQVLSGNQLEFLQDVVGGAGAVRRGVHCCGETGPRPKAGLETGVPAKQEEQEGKQSSTKSFNIQNIQITLVFADDSQLYYSGKCEHPLLITSFRKTEKMLFITAKLALGSPSADSRSALTSQCESVHPDSSQRRLIQEQILKPLSVLRRPAFTASRLPLRSGAALYCLRTPHQAPPTAARRPIRAQSGRAPLCDAAAFRSEIQLPVRCEGNDNYFMISRCERDTNLSTSKGRVRLATEELANYLSDFGSGDGRVHLRVPSLRFLIGRQVGGIKEILKYFFHHPTMSPISPVEDSFFSLTASLTPSGVHHRVRGIATPRQAPETLRPQLRTAASTMEAENMVHSDSMSPASLGICEKFSSGDREAVPPDHAPPGITVVAHVSVRSPPVEKWRPQSTIKYPSPGTPRRPGTLYCCSARRHKQQQETYPQPEGAGKRPSRFTGVNSNTWRLSWGAISKPTPACAAAHPGQLQSSGGPVQPLSSWIPEPKLCVEKATLSGLVDMLEPADGHGRRRPSFEPVLSATCPECSFPNLVTSPDQSMSRWNGNLLFASRKHWWLISMDDMKRRESRGCCGKGVVRVLYPSRVISRGQADGGAKETAELLPKNRDKLRTSVRDNVSSDKTLQSFRPSRLELEGFLDEMIRWFSDHRQQVDELLSHSDIDRTGSVHLKDFELGLMNLDVPCQQFQVDMLSEQLKTSNNTICYRDLSGQLQRLKLSETQTQIKEDVSCLDRRSHRQLLEKDTYLKFVRLSVRMIPFDSAAAHPGNFEVVLSSDSRVFSLIRMIQDRVGIQTTRLEVFRSRVPAEEARLPAESSLEECGFKGGPEESPPEDTVYYDYRLLFTDCPILNCDFRSKPDSAGWRSHCP
ncbi:hypothetical protein L3Q82_013893 [Scortum barcoo]|uniref:Uncharacterized protein n=1 Tax=Scortum barcoo TaxID=214431 RepID=A0ACB8VV87_9TELE|nr:hypothetical protein L3Q82_013893 [Scortum barcoo]